MDLFFTGIAVGFIKQEKFAAIRTAFSEHFVKYPREYENHTDKTYIDPFLDFIVAG